MPYDFSTPPEDGDSGDNNDELAALLLQAFEQSREGIFVSNQTGPPGKISHIDIASALQKQWITYAGNTDGEEAGETLSFYQPTKSLYGEDQTLPAELALKAITARHNRGRHLL